MYFKLTDAEYSFVQKYVAAFPNRLAFIVQLHQIWAKATVTVIDEQTGYVRLKEITSQAVRVFSTANNAQNKSM